MIDFATLKTALQNNAFVESMRALFADGRDLMFLRPWWLLGLLLLPAAILWWRRKRNDQGVWREAIDPHLLRHLLQSEDSLRGGRMQRALRLLGRAAALAGCALAFVALAGPSWRTQPQPLWQDRTPLVIALDLSERVLATDLPPSRLQRARAEIAEVLRRRGGGQMALVVYAGDAFTVSPLTEDGANIALYLDALHPDIMPMRGSRTDRGIAESALLLRRAGFRRGDILVITDMLDGDERRAKNAASEAADQGYRVSVLGLASERGAERVSGRGVTDVIQLDGSALRSLASAGKGRYAAVASDDSDLRSIGILNAQQIDATAAGGKRGEMAMDEGYWLLPLLMLAALFAFRRGVFVVALLCCLPLHPAQAAESDFWLRRDQQQYRRMETAGDAYRKRDYENAERLWREVPTADGAYNRGNALARQRRYPEAIDAYDEALRKQPGMQDAIGNRRAVVEAMRRKPQPPPKNEQGRSKPQNNKQSGKQNEGGDSKQNGQSQQNNDQQQSGGTPKQGQNPPQKPPQNSSDPKNQQQQTPQDQKNSGAQNQNRQNQGNQSQSPQDQGKQDQNNKSQQPQNRRTQQNPAQNRQSPSQRDPSTSPSDAKRDDPKAQRAADAAQREKMDRALAQRPRPVPAGEGERGKVKETAEQQQQRMFNEARLRRVQDDPGGLLRAKFNQEYRRRSRGDDRR
jgi:Ca-activated chloride channel homolog